ncbi:uncharacterized protein LOC109596602 isoform X2 [Aethina tumida]|uniref:uncharacterized protein LOC109596602 isoform X2 n=1 Tax=Aethina tumida TaxID=116153 RepID=UPI002148474F|nr:uncharacterized protein LOC109596602 isoform X2 [Aethina tumida]
MKLLMISLRRFYLGCINFKMGCNTSKESVPQNEAGQNNENRETEEKSDKEDSKPPSAKTITLEKSSPTKLAEGNNSISHNTKEVKKIEELNSSKEGQPIGDSGTAQKTDEEAATKIQAAFRGHRTRKTMKQPEKSNPSEPEPTREELEQEFRADDVELCQAATKIQASFRGHMSRKQDKKEDDNNGHTSKNENQEEELDIDLADPELNKAAVKIQASFRGHLVRKHDDEVQEN